MLPTVCILSGYMKTKLIVIFCIFVLPQISEAIEYIVQLQSGYTLRIVTPGQISFLSAMSTGENIEVSIISNNPQQEQFDQGSGFSLINSLLPEAIALHQQYLQGQIMHSQTIQFQPVHFAAVVPSQSTQVLTQHIQQSVASQKASSRQSRYFMKLDEQGVKKYPCSFPNCSREFTNTLSRGDHHKSHFTTEFLSSLGKGNQVACPTCQKLIFGTLAAVMIHISKQHKYK